MERKRGHAMKFIPDLYTPDGLEYLGPIIGYEALSYARRLNHIGSLELTAPRELIPAAISEGDATRLRDYRIVVRRLRDDGSSEIDMSTVWFVRYMKRSLDRKGETITLHAFDATHLLKRRIIAYAAGSAQSSKTGAIDNMMRAFVRENLGSSAGTGRVLGDLFIGPDRSQAPTGSKAAAWRNLHDTLLDLANDATARGAWLGFDIVADSASALRFDTYVGRRGSDKRQILNIGPGFGNLVGASLVFDAREELTFITAGGQGEEELRELGTASDPIRIALSPYNRLEGFRQATHIEPPAGTALTDEARSLLHERRPAYFFEGTLISTDAAPYGDAFVLGDEVRVSAFDLSLDVLVEAVKVAATPTRTDVQAHLRTVQA